jgi:hypothetical protein
MKRWIVLWLLAAIGIAVHQLLAHGLCGEGAGALLAAGSGASPGAVVASLALLGLRLAGIPLLAGLAGVSLGQISAKVAAKAANRVARPTRGWQNRPTPL